LTYRSHVDLQKSRDEHSLMSTMPVEQHTLTYRSHGMSIGCTLLASTLAHVQWLQASLGHGNCTSDPELAEAGSEGHQRAGILCKDLTKCMSRLEKGVSM